MMNSRRTLLLSALLFASCWGSACSLLGMGALQVGTPAPDFTLTSINDETVSFSDFAGQPVLLIFWSPTCTPCLRELPVLAALEEVFTSEDLAVVTICSGSSDDARDALRETNVALVTLLDTGSRTFDAYRVRGKPSVYLVGSDGEILMIRVGPSQDRGEALRAEIRRLLGE